MKTEFAVLKNVQGVTGNNSLISWSGKPFKTYANKNDALADCNFANKIYRENGLSYAAYVEEGNLTQSGWVKA